MKDDHIQVISVVVPGAKKEYKSQAARDASKRYGKSYCEYLDRKAQEHYDYFKARGDATAAEKMLTQSLGEALMGNDGD